MNFFGRHAFAFDDRQRTVFLQNPKNDIARFVAVVAPMNVRSPRFEVVSKLLNGADAMRDSANIYLSWAKHYVNLSEGGASEADEGEEDSVDFQF